MVIELRLDQATLFSASARMQKDFDSHFDAGDRSGELRFDHSVSSLGCVAAELEALYEHQGASVVSSNPPGEADGRSFEQKGAACGAIQVSRDPESRRVAADCKQWN